MVATIATPHARPAVAFAGSQGNFELNAMRPLIINNVLHSARILAGGMEKFRTFSVSGIELNHDRIDQHVSESLMLVTALSPVIGGWPVHGFVLELYSLRATKDGDRHTWAQYFQHQAVDTRDERFL